MGYIEINDELSVYSVTDDLAKLFDWGIFLLQSLSLPYYILMALGFTILILVTVALRVGAMGKRYLNNGKRD